MPGLNRIQHPKKKLRTKGGKLKCNKIEKARPAAVSKVAAAVSKVAAAVSKVAAANRVAAVVKVVAAANRVAAVVKVVAAANRVAAAAKVAAAATTKEWPSESKPFDCRSPFQPGSLRANKLQCRTFPEVGSNGTHL
jgi:hypothetical protein